MRPFFELRLKPSPIGIIRVNFLSAIGIMAPFPESPAAFENHSVYSGLDYKKNLIRFLPTTLAG